MANYMTAAICKMTGNQPASACTSAVQSLEGSVCSADSKGASGHAGYNLASRAGRVKAGTAQRTSRETTGGEARMTASKSSRARNARNGAQAGRPGTDGQGGTAVKNGTAAEAAVRPGTATPPGTGRDTIGADRARTGSRPVRRGWSRPRTPDVRARRGARSSFLAADRHVRAGAGRAGRVDLPDHRSLHRVDAGRMLGVGAGELHQGHHQPAVYVFGIRSPSSGWRSTCSRWRS